MTRTIVFSDIHGEPSLIDAVVTHSNYRPGIDRLIFAGDAVEIGRDSLGCLERLAELGAECLVGNHDYAYFTADPIENEPLDERLIGPLTDAIASGRWKLAAEADGVLITHAGVSELLTNHYNQAGSVTAFVEALNAAFARAVRSYVTIGDGEFDEAGPLWWRPGWGVEPLPGVVQVVGHTPREMMRAQHNPEDWEGRGLYLVDPYVRGWRVRHFQPPAPVRYAVIDAGHVRVIDA